MLSNFRSLLTGAVVLLSFAFIVPLPAEQARRTFTPIALKTMRGIAVDASENLYVTDVATATVHQLTPAGKDLVLTRAIKSPFGIAVDRHGTVYVSDDHNNAIYRLESDGTPVSLVKFGDPAGTEDATTLAVDSHGNVFVGDNHHHVIREITPAGELTTFAGKVGEVSSRDGMGDAARFSGPRGIAIDSTDTLYVADEINANIRKITPTAMVTTIAGIAGRPGAMDGPASIAQFATPRGLAVDRVRNVYVADTNSHTIRKITSDGTVSTVVGRAGEVGSIDGPAGQSRLDQPRAVAIDHVGNVFIVDNGNDAIRELTPDGQVTTIAGRAR